MDAPADPVRALAARAVSLLSLREHSRQELREKLLGKTGARPEDVDAVLASLEERGWLSDGRYAEARVRQRRMRWGDRRIAFELRRKGVSEENIREALREEGGGEEARAREIWRHRFGGPPGDAKERARQARFLAARGFSWDVISRVVPRPSLRGEDWDGEFPD